MAQDVESSIIFSLLMPYIGHGSLQSSIRSRKGVMSRKWLVAVASDPRL